MTTEIKPVTIPREVADAIEWFREDVGGSLAYDNAKITQVVFTQTPTNYHEAALRKIPFDTLLRALLDGYERELTEEEAREKAYAEIKRIYDIPCDDDDYNAGMRFVLDALGIVIPGVNDSEVSA